MLKTRYLVINNRQEAEVLETVVAKVYKTYKIIAKKGVFQNQNQNAGPRLRNNHLIFPLHL